MITKVFNKLLSYLTTLTNKSVKYFINKKKYKWNEVGNNKIDVLFLPYFSNDCYIQHFVIAKKIDRLGFDTNIYIRDYETLKYKKAESEVSSVFPKDLNFQDNIEFITEVLSSYDRTIQMAAIDLFVKNCDLDFFTSKKAIAKDWFREQIAKVQEAKRLASVANVFVLPDSAYVFNSSLKYFALRENKKVFILNPHGQFKRIHSENQSEFTCMQSDYHLLNQNLNDLNEEMSLAKDYFEKSLIGKASVDPMSENENKDLNPVDSQEKLKKTKYRSVKKVLYLHAFRDANNLTSPTENIFKTYYEWADEALKIIKNQQDQWYIKPHPSSHFYNNDSSILDYLLTKHDIDSSLITSTPKKKVILDKEMPIFTFSGTVAIESAMVGFRSFVISSRFPKEVVFKVNSKERFLELYSKNIEDLMQIDLTISNPVVYAIFYYMYVQKKAKEISPKVSRLPSNSAIRRNINSLRSTFYILILLLQSEFQNKAGKIASELVD